MNEWQSRSTVAPSLVLVSISTLVERAQAPSAICVPMLCLGSESCFANLVHLGKAVELVTPLSQIILHISSLHFGEVWWADDVISDPAVCLSFGIHQEDIFFTMGKKVQVMSAWSYIVQCWSWPQCETPGISISWILRQLNVLEGSDDVMRAAHVPQAGSRFRLVVWLKARLVVYP